MYGAESNEIYLDRVTKVEKMDRRNIWKIMGEKFQNDERNKVSYSKAQTPPKK